MTEKENRQKNFEQITTMLAGDGLELTPARQEMMRPLLMGEMTLDKYEQELLRQLAELQAQS